MPCCYVNRNDEKCQFKNIAESEIKKFEGKEYCKFHVPNGEGEFCLIDILKGISQQYDSYNYVEIPDEENSDEASVKDNKIVCEEIILYGINCESLYLSMCRELDGTLYCISDCFNNIVISNLIIHESCIQDLYSSIRNISIHDSYIDILLMKGENLTINNSNVHKKADIIGNGSTHLSETRFKNISINSGIVNFTNIYW